LFSLSKAYGFASWRIGYMVIPETLTVAVRKAQDTILICPAAISQAAATAALSVGRDYCRPKIERLAKVRHYLLEELESLRSFCSIPPALGAFYLLLRIDSPLDPMTITERLICEFGVAVIPGTTFGIESGCHLRVAYGALDDETIAEATGRLTRG